MQMLDHIIGSNHIDALSEVRAWPPAQCGLHWRLCGLRWLLRSMGQAADCWTTVLLSLPPHYLLPSALVHHLSSLPLCTPPPPSWTCNASRARPCQAAAYYS